MGLGLSLYVQDAVALSRGDGMCSHLFSGNTCSTRVLFVIACSLDSTRLVSRASTLQARTKMSFSTQQHI